MKESMTQYSRRRGTWLLVALIAVIVALPVAAIAGYWVSSAIGRTTEVQAPDGSTKTLYWREYPGTAELDPREVLDGPTPQQGLAAGERMITEIQEALDREFSLNWTPIQPTHEQGPFNTPVSNDFGGYSLLTNVNGPERQSTTVPRRGPVNSKPWTSSIRCCSTTITVRSSSKARMAARLFRVRW